MSEVCVSSPETKPLSRLRIVSPGEERPEDDRALVAGVRAGEPGAAGRVWDRYASLVRGILRHMLSPVDVEDAIQDAFLRLFRDLGSLRDPAALRSFLIGITLHVAKSELRRRAAPSAGCFSSTTVSSRTRGPRRGRMGRTARAAVLPPLPGARAHQRRAPHGVRASLRRRARPRGDVDGAGLLSRGRPRGAWPTRPSACISWRRPIRSWPLAHLESRARRPSRDASPTKGAAKGACARRTCARRPGR